MSTFKVVPLRNDGKGWRLTEPHKAQAWAVAAFARGERMKVLFRLPTKAEAEAVLTSAQRATAGWPRRYRLGARMPQRETKS